MEGSEEVGAVLTIPASESPSLILCFGIVGGLRNVGIGPDGSVTYQMVVPGAQVVEVERARSFARDCILSAHIVKGGIG